MRTDRVSREAAGSGSFLDPPTYPTHGLGILLDTNRKPENRGWCSLTVVLEHEDEYGWISPETRAEARRILEAWEAPPIESEPIRDWIHQVLGYFRACYKGPDGPRGPWAAEALEIDHERDPVAHADDHAGVHLIRRFYPDYVPTTADFERAYWGSKPEKETS